MQRRVISLILSTVVLGVAMVGHTVAQTFNTLVSFNGLNGATPNFGPLIQGTDGFLYGETKVGGANNRGTAYKVSTNGTLTTIYSFCALANCVDGTYPWGGLVLATDGNLYGTTASGGANGNGTIFKVTTAGILSTLHNFDGTDGSNAYGGLMQGADGLLYGTTELGGSPQLGTVFKITLSGTFTTIHSFNGTDGAGPYAGLIQANDGILYGTTYGGGANDDGTVFRITPAGVLTTLHNFTGIDGKNPTAALVEGRDGYFYGTTSAGGPGGNPCQCFGTVFQISTAGDFKTLATFSDNGDGTTPLASLIQATDGKLYGTAFGSPQAPAKKSIDGSIFVLSPKSPVSEIYDFGTSYYNGDPEAALLQGTDGNFYGTTLFGGAVPADGTVFKLSTGLGPFVRMLPVSGKVGATIRILGTDLAGTSRVSFNGTAAAFSVAAVTEIIATVPAGATTGTVEVTTPGGTLESNIAFFVRQ